MYSRDPNDENISKTHNYTWQLFALFIICKYAKKKLNYLRRMRTNIFGQKCPFFEKNQINLEISGNCPKLLTFRAFVTHNGHVKG